MRCSTKKGLQFRKADKAWGAKRRSRESGNASQMVVNKFEHAPLDLITYMLPPPYEERITSFEKMCIRYYFEFG